MAWAMAPAVLRTGYWPPFAGFFVFEVAALAAATAMSVFIITEIQKTTPTRMLGKVMAILTTGAQIAAPVGQIAYGFAFEAFASNVWIPLLFAAGMMALVALAARPLFNGRLEADARCRPPGLGPPASHTPVPPDSRAGGI
jgi:hypothetical protein